MIFAAASNVVGEGSSKTVERPADNSTQRQQSTGKTGIASAAKFEDRVGAIKPASRLADSGTAVPNGANGRPLGEPFNLAARRSGQLAAKQSDLHRKANAIQAGQTFAVALNSPALRVAGNDNAPLKIEHKREKPPPRSFMPAINAGPAKADPVIVPLSKAGGDVERVEPKLDITSAGDFSSEPMYSVPEQFEDTVPRSLQEFERDGEFDLAEPPGKTRIGLLLLLVIAFLLGAAGVAIVPAAWSKITALTAQHFRSGQNLTDIGWTSDPLVLPRMRRDNRHFSFLDLVINRATKQPYVEDAPQAGSPPGEANAIAAGDASAAEEGSEDQPLPDADLVTAGPETPIEGSVRSLPSLYFDPATGKQLIGNFATRSFPGDHAACTEIAQAMLLDAQAKQDALYTLADTKAIKVMRFCAANGTVITTCRNGRITISPRRPRPDDGCSAAKPSNKAAQAQQT